jgi:uncharacterized membrane protein
MQPNSKPVVELFLILVSLLALDAVYLSMIYATFGQMIQGIQGSAMALNIWGAVLCYAALTLGLWYFIVREKRSPLDAGLFGLVIYTVYEMTSMATLKKWEPMIALIDSVWGFVLFYLATSAVYFLEKRI